MTTLTTNRFLTKALRILCCAGALTACSAWATVVTWQLSPAGASGKVGASSQSRYAITPWRVEVAPVTDASHAFSFKSAQESGAASETTAAVAGSLNHMPEAGETSAGLAGILNHKPQASETSATMAGTLNHKPHTSETSAAVAGTLNNKLQASDTDIQLGSQSTLSQGGGQISTRSTQPYESSLFAASNAPARPATELDDAMAKSFDEEFVSVPTVQFAAMATGSMDISGTSAAAGTIVPLPEMSALFPIVGLIAAVSCTQILRRRRAAQQSAPRSVV
jgi:hypothetical protein